MKLSSFVAVAALTSAAALPALADPLVNGGFESGLSNWTQAGSGTSAAVGQAQDFSGTPYLPTEGNAFAILTPGGPDDTTLSQSFSLSSAGEISFDVAFLAFDDFDHDDAGFVHLFDSEDNEIDAFQTSVTELPQFGSTGWLHITQSLGAGSYTFVAGVRDVGDDQTEPFEPGFDSQLLVDNLAVSVPEPESWALMILGFAGLGAALRARRSAGLRRA